jgi:hypothetical protein
LQVLELVFGDVARLTINFLEGESIKGSNDTWFFNARIDFDYFLQEYFNLYRDKFKKAIHEKSEIEDDNTRNGLVNRIRSSGKGHYSDSLIDFDGNFFNDEDIKSYPSLKSVERIISKELSERLDIDCFSSVIDNRLFFSPSNKSFQENDSLGKIHGVIDELLSLDYYESNDSAGDGNRFFNTIVKHLTENGDKLMTKSRNIDGTFIEKDEKGNEYICGSIQADCYICPRFSESFVSFINLLNRDLQTIFTISRIEIQKTVKLEALRATSDRIYQYKQDHIPLTREIINAAENSDKKKQGEFFKYWTGSEKFNFFEESKFIIIHGVGYRFEVLKDGTKRELPDLGYGTRQVIPVILGIYNNKQIPFIIEEPESNLHPRLQSLLADLFVKLKKENPDSPLIIETHSEYLIRKLQFLVAKGDISSEEIALTYISNIGGKLTVQKMDFRKDGIIKQDFGEGFFDESMRWTRELLNLKILN